LSYDSDVVIKRVGQWKKLLVLLILDVRLKNYGREMIEVIDNGCGVDEPDFQALSMSVSVASDFSTRSHNNNTF